MMSSMSPLHRDAQGRRIVESTHEGLVDRLIREARERGDWDDTAYRGRPLPDGADEAYAGDWAAANRLLRDAGAAPPWIEADREARRLLVERDRLREAARRASPLGRRQLRHRLEDLVAAYNRATLALNSQAPTPRQHRRPLALRQELAAIDV
jgi:hypothetical protein